ncbi:MAG: hypothetical protein ACTSUV_02375 [Candidatus Ranarchaeia archaeon]
MEELVLTNKTLEIAKAEFYIQTSSFRKRRKLYSVGLYLFGLIWALVIVPSIITFLIDSLASILVPIFIVGLPGFMRSGMMMLWMFLLFFPISLALKEIKVGQWELMLSNNVNTKNILFGGFIGKLPSYGLVILFVAPIFLSPFAHAFQVSMLGQSLMYLTLFFVCVSTLWFSEVLTIAIQSKLGESPRGKDIANGLGYLLALLVVIPMYGLMFFGDIFTQILGLNVLQVLPFTWSADMLSWIIILFNGINLTAPQIAFMQLVLQMDVIINSGLMIGFSLAVVIFAVVSADRFFTFEGGARTEKVTTIMKENVIIKLIRKAIPGPFGIRLITSLKDFGRKAQNLAGLSYGIVLGIILPFIMNIQNGGEGSDALDLLMVTIMGAIMLAAMSGMAFGGIGFLDSRDQLWVLKSAPNGPKKFIKARIAQGLIFALPVVVIVSISTMFLMNLEPIRVIINSVYSYILIIPSIMIGVGVTASNPDYEDTKSAAFKANAMTITMSITFSGIAAIMLPVFLDILNVPILKDLVWDNMLILLALPAIFLYILGTFYLTAGIRSLSRPE